MQKRPIVFEQGKANGEQHTSRGGVIRAIKWGKPYLAKPKSTGNRRQELWM